MTVERDGAMDRFEEMYRGRCPFVAPSLRPFRILCEGLTYRCSHVLFRMFILIDHILSFIAHRFLSTFNGENKIQKQISQEGFV